ncbi:MAG: M28 family peptidase [Planctomycetes bacterium]|nr:M28 family peptidase [Planctomycetota bacterium]
MISTPFRCLTLALVLTVATPAQELSVLDPAATRWITQEVSGDAAYAHIRFMTTTVHRPRGGSDGLMKVARYFEERAREIGLDDVQLILQPDDTRPWNAKFADLWLMTPQPERLASTLQTAVHLADFSRAADVTAELVDIGAGAEADYAGKEVKAKLVLTYGSLGGVMREAVQKRGAAGVIWYPSPFSPGNGIDGGGMTRPDQIRWQSISSEDGDGAPPTFAFVLSLRQGLLLRQKLAGAKEPLKAHAVVEASFDSTNGPKPWQVLVEGFIRGSDASAHQDVVFTGHMQEEAYSANDDASGCASTLEVARALKALIDSGRIARPKRNLRFWWTTEISSERQYFADHPEVARELWVDVNQDMVGADQSLDIMRKQCVTKLPAARFHFLNDVTEAALEYVVAVNNFELAQLENGIALYPEPLVAHKGSWQRFNAEAIYFHTSTDHMTFLEAPIGIPAITFTNMPDRYIHSSDDDLWNIDATQLGRCAASAALIGYTMASAEERTLPRLAPEVVGRGAERLARNLHVALTALTPKAAPSAFHEGLDQLAFAAERERLALRSLKDAGAKPAELDGWLAALAQRETQARTELESAWRRVSGTATSPARTSSEAETRLAKLHPALVGGPREFQTKRDAIAGVPGLHDLMAYEVMNAIDGTRSGLDLARFVAAEAREAGAHYYGTVTPEAVLAYLENAQKSGLVRLE